jgi:glycosyltransferase involved in cell wall biosynthesis
MQVSFNNPNNAVWTGYGHATMRIVSSLSRTKHTVGYSLPNADLEIFFGHAEDYKYINPKSYKVGYTAWESTQFPSNWIESGNLDIVDEFWVPNKFCKDVFKQYTDKDVHIFRHGLDKTFQPQEREVTDTIKFIHIGYPAYRKNLYDTVNAFLELYSGRKDVTLTIKGYQHVQLPEFDNEPNINVIGETYTSFEMIKLLKEHHALIYPSWGEGFGLIPLQTLGTGMPSIVSGGWCDYPEYVGELMVKSTLTHNPFTIAHPGFMYKVDYEDLVKTMLYTEKNIETLLPQYYDQAPKIHKEYSWDDIVTEYFDNVAKRLMLQ